MNTKTTRQRVQRILELSVNGITPTRISERFPEKELSSEDVLEHIEHIKESEDVHVAPPECGECGATFEEVLNVPSRCYKCRAGQAHVKEPLFIITEQDT